MANANSPKGFRPVLDSSNRRYTGGGNTYYVSTSDSNNIFIGDPVVKSGSGDANGVPGVVLATAGTGHALTGFVVGFAPGADGYDTLRSYGYRPASTAAYLIVEDDPNVTFEGQASTAAATDIGSNINLAAGTGNRINQSRWYANGSQIATTSTYQLRLLGFAQRADNATGAYAKVLVRINNGTEAPSSTGI